MSGDPKLPLGDQRPRSEPEIRYTKTSSAPRSSAREDVALPRGLVVADLKLLRPGQRNVAARLAGVPESTVDRLAAAGLILPVASADSLALAQARAAELSSRVDGLQAVDSAAFTPSWTWLSLLAGFLGTIALGMLGVLFTPFLFLLPLLWMASLAFTAAGAWQGHTRQKRTLEAWHILHEARSQGSPRNRAAQERARALHQRLSQADLPDVARSDIERSLGEVQTQLEQLAQSPDTDDSAYDALEGALAAVERQTAPSQAQADDAAQRLLGAAKALGDLDMGPDPKSAEARANARLAAARAKKTEGH